MARDGSILGWLTRGKVITATRRRHLKEQRSYCPIAVCRGNIWRMNITPSGARVTPNGPRHGLKLYRRRKGILRKRRPRAHSEDGATAPGLIAAFALSGARVDRRPFAR